MFWPDCAPNWPIRAILSSWSLEYMVWVYGACWKCSNFDACKRCKIILNVCSATQFKEFKDPFWSQTKSQFWYVDSRESSEQFFLAVWSTVLSCSEHRVVQIFRTFLKAKSLKALNGQKSNSCSKNLKRAIILFRTLFESSKQELLRAFPNKIDYAAW